jgi:hypothetical protein
VRITETNEHDDRQHGLGPTDTGAGEDRWHGQRSYRPQLGVAPVGTGTQPAGYKRYWRLATEPQWTHCIYVGDATSHALKNVVIGNALL